MTTITIIGLGYVGLPLAVLCAEKGLNVQGLDVSEEKVNSLKKGENPFPEDKVLQKGLDATQGKVNYTTNPEALKQSSVVITCVPTPVDYSHHPDYTPLKNASKTIAENLQEGQLVIVESTISPFTMEDVVQPILEKTGLKAGTDFYLAHCPERVNPGDQKWTVKNLPRVVGGATNECTQKARQFYESILEAEVMPLSSMRAAEAVKITENSFRDVNLAFVNELAQSFDRLGIDAKEVIQAASSKPFSFMPHWPGCGVGGHCIAVDPYYMIETAKQKGFTHQFMILAREINNSMPLFTVEKVSEALNEASKSIKGSKITVLGVSYKGGVGDVRESPAEKIIQHLEKRGALLKIFDPYVSSKSTVKSLDDALTDTDCVVLCTDHPEFKEIELEKFKDFGVKALVDGRNVYDYKKARDLGLVYRGIGRGHSL